MPFSQKLLNACQLQCPLTDSLPQEADSKTKFSERTGYLVSCAFGINTCRREKKEAGMEIGRIQARMQTQWQSQPHRSSWGRMLDFSWIGPKWPDLYTPASVRSCSWRGYNLGQGSWDNFRRDRQLKVVCWEHFSSLKGTWQCRKVISNRSSDIRHSTKSSMWPNCHGHTLSRSWCTGGVPNQG